MIITKEEKKIYAFLDIVYMLFGKALGRKVLFGKENDLYFYCEGYAGYFTQEDYSFENFCYTIGKTPDANYVIEEDKRLEMIEHSLSLNIKKMIDSNSKRLEIATKVEDCKIAKIAIDTGFWLKDDDLKILSKYRFFMVKMPRGFENVLLITEENNSYSSNIIFNFDCTYTKIPTQLSFDTAEEIEKPVVVISSKEEYEALNADAEEQELDDLMQEAEEEEDEFDPMA